MKKMYRKTYHNFMIVANALMREKGYTFDEATKLTHNVFANVEANPGRHAEEFYRPIISKAEYEAEYGIQ